jgi:hypothetical protein
VRQHFSQIIFFGAEESGEENRSGGTKKKGMDMDEGVVRHDNRGPNQKDGKLLVVIELDDRDVKEGAWRKLLSAAARRRLPGGSKVIVASKSEKAVAGFGFGTTEAVRLDFFPRDACWYFFKVLLFGSAHAEADQPPKLTSIAMEILEEYTTGKTLCSGASRALVRILFLLLLRKHIQCT